ncbi:ribbon-helix-helix protein, CopG family [Deinococcus aerius]|nr:ribbon-helix-helix protein, CopG family [Deinococcus aerius]
MPKAIKVSVNLAEQDVEFLEKVAQATGMSMSAVIRHAIGLERLAQEVRENRKMKLLLEDGCRMYLVQL